MKMNVFYLKYEKEQSISLINVNEKKTTITEKIETEKEKVKNEMQKKAENTFIIVKKR